MNAKAAYLIDSVRKVTFNWKSDCPNCHKPLSGAAVIDRKYVVTKLVECPHCTLLVRTPTDDGEESNAFYQEAYDQGYTTDCPDDATLQQLIAESFVGSPCDYSRYLRFFEYLKIPTSNSVLDFGCSWGYGLYQFSKAGYPSKGFEVSVPRARYGRDKMQLDISSDMKDINGPFDVIFSSHVLEHLPDFSVVNELIEKRLKPGGYFIAVTPNGSADFRKKSFDAFHHLWGKVHPILLSDKFVSKNYQSGLQYLASWGNDTPDFRIQNKMDLWELVFVLRKS